MKLVNRKFIQQSGFALIITLGVFFCCIVILFGVLDRSRTVATMNNRSNSLLLCNSAAEAAVEKAYARMASDFASYGVALVSNNLTSYQSSVPNEDPYWASNFTFSDSQGNAGHTYVSYAYTYAGPLPSAYTGLTCANSPVYRIVSDATYNLAGTNLIGTAQEDVLLACVPLTTWAIFYNGALEFTDCATQTVAGNVHANGPIYVGTLASLTFSNPVSCTGTLTAPLVDGLYGASGIWDPATSSTWHTYFNGSPTYTTNVANVTVSMDMTNSHYLIDIPTDAYDWQSSTGKQRLYNQAQFILIVTNDPTSISNNGPTVVMTLQRSYNGDVPAADPNRNSANQTFVFSNSTPTSLATNLPFLTLTNQFYDAREYKTNMVTQIDMSVLTPWLQTNSAVNAVLQTNQSLYPTIMYVADRRNASATKMPVVRLAKGAQIPSNGNMGFSVATPNPLYVWDSYNTKTSAGTNSNAGSTTNTYPSALMSDSLTILSGSWLDSDSYVAYSSGGTANSVYNAKDIVINAAIVTGTVPSTDTTSSTFSGGVHNLPRLLENWAGDNIWLNTSILRLWSSTIATNQFRDPLGFPSTPAPVSPYYNAPNRHYAYDLNFLNPAKVPPGIPVALVPIRFGWARPSPNAIYTNLTSNHD